MPRSQISGSADGIFVHGSRPYENNYQVDGISVNDTQGSGSSSGGIPIPNLDITQELKVRTGLYNAAYGRLGGANVSVVTRTGGNELPREPRSSSGALKDKLFFFGSYQGTRQINRLASGLARIACTAVLRTAPLANDRSVAELGALLAGKTGALGGVAIASDGSNINPVALNLFSFKLPGGSYMIPTPQIVDPSAPFALCSFRLLRPEGRSKNLTKF